VSSALDLAATGVQRSGPRWEEPAVPAHDGDGLARLEATAGTRGR
jgi:hypothetical protein